MWKSCISEEIWVTTIYPDTYNKCVKVIKYKCNINASANKMV